jgi:hypothetical protein
VCARNVAVLSSSSCRHGCANSAPVSPGTAIRPRQSITASAAGTHFRPKRPNQGPSPDVYAHFMRVVIVVVLGTTLAGCAIQRAQVAQDARAQMVGMSKEQVLTCMGPPGTKAAEGATEVWSYASGDGHTQTFGTATANTTAEANRFGNTVYGSANTFGTASAVSTRRFCQINVVMSGGAVSAVNYQGPTGGLLTAGEQCARDVALSSKQGRL